MKWRIFALLVLLITGLSFAPYTVHADEPSFVIRHFFGPEGDDTHSVVLGDVNGDGHLDLIVGNFTHPSMVYWNDGHGNFPKEQGHSFSAGNSATHSVAVGDVNGDGYLDLITGNYEKQKWVYINDGQGDFAKLPVRPVDVNNAKTLTVALGDVNGDGHLDLIIGNDGQQSLVYWNDGWGNFPPQNAHPFGAATDKTFSVAAGDMNGDGFLDLIVGRGNDSGADPGKDGAQNFVYLNDGLGNFPSANARPFGTGNDDTRSVQVGDMNGDGYLDLVTANWRDRDAVYLNDGAGNFPKATERILQTTDEGNFAVALGDVDADGDLDILSGIHGQSMLYFNDGAGNFQASAFGTGSVSTRSVAIGDLNGDGHLDIVSGNNGYQSVVHLSNGAGSFAEAKARVLRKGADVTLSMAVGDLNRDGYLDLIAGNEFAQNAVYLNDGYGNFPQEQRYLFGTNNDKSRSVAVGDVNEDGYLDLIVGNEGTQNWVYINDGTGDFQTGGDPARERKFGTGSDQTTSVALGDVDGDGHLDIVTGNGNEPNMVYLNNGLGYFQQETRPFGTGSDATLGVAVGDVDRDGHLDLITRNSGQSMVYLNDGDGNFPQEKGRPFTAGLNLRQSMTVGDMDGDGYLDIIIGNWGQNVINLNDGKGNFPEDKLHFFGAGADRTYSVPIGDLDGDGDLDLIAGNATERNIAYFNDGTGNFPETIRMPFTTGSRNTIAVAVGDVDGDGDLDLISGNHGSPNVVNLNEMQQRLNVGNPGLRLTVTRPGNTANANFFSAPTLLSSPTISIPYTIFDPEGERVGLVEAFYSPDGGGHWSPAVAATGTVTQNLQTGRTLVRAHVSPVLTIAAATSQPLQSSLHIQEQNTVADVEVWVAITHPNNRDLSIALQSPQGTIVPLVATGQAQGQNFGSTRFAPWATTKILSDTAPYAGVYKPVGNLVAFKGEMSVGDWTLTIINTGAATGQLTAWGLRLRSLPTTHFFFWDTFASGFWGQSDNVVVRLVAYNHPLSTTMALAGTYRYTSTVPGPYQYPYVSATTFPFRVRGTQVRVLDSSDKPVANALVYRLPQGATTGAEPMPDLSQPFTTTRNGYLLGRGELTVGDQLVALAPISHTLNYTLYATSAAPTENGLAFQAVTHSGVQTLTVSAAHPLLLFDLDVSLEWDASQDGVFYDQLKTAFERASAILYDVSDGQIALGEVRIHPNREAWLSADVVIYANNNLRPRATMGGLVETPEDDVQVASGKPLKAAYTPGQVRMGPIWDPFGQNFAELTQDWQRALAHELAHYLLYLPDNYLGVEKGILRITNCQGSLMTDAYNPDYSEFLTSTEWTQPPGNPCLHSVAATLLTGRSDWATVTHFYPALHIPQNKLKGPALLPLNVTHVRVIPPATGQTQPVAARNYDLRNEAGNVTPLRQAQAYVLQGQGTETNTDDSLLYLGSTGVGSDRILVRGARSGDKVCVIDNVSEPVRAGCAAVTTQSTAIQVHTVAGWRPEIQVSPMTSTTFQITVTQAGDVGQLFAQLLPAYGPREDASAIRSVTQPLTPASDTHSGILSGTYSAKISLPYPIFEGFVRVYSAQEPEQHQAISQFFLGGDWGPPGGWIGSGANRAWGANTRSMEAPVASGDGKVTILNLDDLLANTGDTTLQAVNNLPNLPPWLTAVGAGYRIQSDRDITRTLMFEYNQRDVPPGYEQTLNIYYLPANASAWQRLKTGPLDSGVDVDDNLATVVMPHANQGQGMYALLATVQLQPLLPGWNALTYPVGAANPVTKALASLAGDYTLVYEVRPSQPGAWPLYDRTVDPRFAPLVNTLTTMSFGNNYLIYATQIVTPYLPVVSDPQSATAAAATPGGLLEPPATFYGFVPNQQSAAWQAGMSLVAQIGTVTCGESRLQMWQGQLAYVIQVRADDGDGCGQVGRTVSFAIDGKPSPLSAPWDNRQTTQLLAGGKLYLPIVAR